MIAIAVQDTGVGIPPENMKKLFEPLFTTKAKGIGLGLAVSQKLVEANGGRIEVQSEAGVGSTFTVYLPVKAMRCHCEEDALSDTYPECSYRDEAISSNYEIASGKEQERPRNTCAVRQRGVTWMNKRKKICLLKRVP